MRILILHSRYMSGAASGENSVVHDEARLLATGGHDVRTWEPAPGDVTGLGLLRTGAGAVWSRSAAERASQIVREMAAEVVHIHNLFPSLSPAVLRAVRRRGAAVVVTLHNYRLMCLPATFLREEQVCEDCRGRLPWPGVVHGCYRDSVPGSAALALSLSLHRAIRTFDHVALFLPVGEFVRRKYIDAGFPPDRLAVKSNFAWPTVRRNGPGSHFLFVGRVSPEKGLETIIRAWKTMGAKLIVVGDGPDAARLRALAPEDVEFVGAVSQDRVTEYLRGARALVVPSVWYEAQPRVILEAYAAGVPVLASRIGGLPDHVLEDRSGYLVQPKDAAAWADAFDKLLDDDRSKRLGDGAYELWEERHSPEQGLKGLENAYRRAITIA